MSTAAADQEITIEDQEMSTGAYNSHQVIELARTSLDFLAALCMPSAFKYLYPQEYKAIWQWLLTYVHKKRDFSQLALGIPRGFAKTTFIKVFILYVLLFTEKKFIAVCCENEQKAVNIVTDVMKMLSERNILSVFGNWKIGIETDMKAEKVFSFRGRTIAIWAGTVETIRGKNIDNARPDVMIFEDIQSRKDADSETVSDTIEREMYGTAMKAKSPEGCLFIFVGNMYPTKFSILRKLKKNPNWFKFITGGILADGTSLWEELHPVEQLHKEFLNDLLSGRPEIFYSEVLNDEEANVNSSIDLSKIPLYTISDTDIPGGKFLIIDPATDKIGSDAVSIGYIEVHSGVPVLRKLVEGRLSPGDTIRESLKLCFTYGVSFIAIESNAYQYSLLYWFGVITTQMGITGIEVGDVYSGVNSKNSRILSMFKQLLKAETQVHPDCQAAAWLQATQFIPTKRDNTDGVLDLLTYTHKVMEMYPGQIIASNVIDEQEYGNVKVLEDNSCF